MSEESPRYFEDLAPGDVVSYRRRVGDDEIEGFARISGDDNPLHLDDAYAATTRFGGRIAHGMLSASFISTLMGVKLGVPGVVYLKQSLSFRAPVRPGDEVVATATVVSKEAGKNRVVLATTCTVEGTVVIDGEALVIVPSRP